MVKIKEVASCSNKRMVVVVFSSILAMTLLMNPVLADALHKGNMNILRPLIEVSDSSVLFQNNQNDDENYVTRRGSVVLDVNQLLPQMPIDTTKEDNALSFSFVQQTFVMDFFPDRSIVVIVAQESRPSHGVVSLNARTIDQDIATVSITVTEESYLITFQDLTTNTLYRVVGNSETGVGNVKEIDIGSLPPRMHLPPIVID